jgi:hypothetical protein
MSSLNFESKKPAEFAGEFAEKYHPVSGGSAGDVARVAEDFYVRINGIYQQLGTELIGAGEKERRIVADTEKMLEKLREEFTPRIVQAGQEVSQLEKSQRVDQRLAIIATIVAVVGIFLPLFL